MAQRFHALLVVRDEADVVVAATPGMFEVLAGLLEALSA